MNESSAVSRFLEFSRAEWAQLRDATPLPLTEPQLRRLVSVNERMSLDEVADIYLPLSRLLNLYVGATHNLHAASATFLGTDTPRVPFVIGIAGSVAREVGLNLPLNAATEAQYQKMVKLGLGGLDKSGIAELTFKGRHA